MKIGILGHFGVGENLLNGQTVKTKMLADGLEKYANIEVVKIDSHNWVKRPFKLHTNIKNAFQNCDAIVMLPAQNGVRIFTPILLHFKKKYGKKVFYDVIGGWLPEFLDGKVGLSNRLRKFDGIWVETNTMKNKLLEQGFDNVVIVPNFKEIQPLSESELVYPEGVPYRLCTFSRVMKEKGIETAVNAIEKVNKKLGYIAYSLDIYGQIWEESKEWFDELQNKLPDYVQYKGSVSADKSVEVLQNYFALVFPTHFYTEGIPGTIIDSYAAGLPVISAKWESFADVVDEGETGIGYEFDNVAEFEQVLLQVATNPKAILDMKANCREKAKNYIPEKAIEVMTEKFGGGGYNLYPLKLCTFSRVMKEKGIEDAIVAVKTVNKEWGFEALSLDIYGQVWEEYKERFDMVQKDFPSYVRYCGSIDADKSVEALKDYFALLFPTYYEGEGFAGTLIDAFSAGVPVIATDWRYNAELVSDKTGYVFSTGNQIEFERILKEIVLNPTLILNKKQYCIKEADRYSIDKAIQMLIHELE